MQHSTPQRSFSWARMALMAGLAVVTMIGLLWFLVLGSSPGRSPASAAGTAKKITAEEFGAAWPFTVDEGTVRCERSGATVFIADGTIYALNTTARMGRDAVKGEALWKITREQPGNPQAFMSVSPIEEIGESLCK